ncbi:helix-turn-helix domain-containing protein [Oceanibacterium hippocampi]|uniref:Transcriptional repressor DicA n=1 Tax=Oceanibacterium hippocampi TaxID=745714 RepID=A0A1Y5T570_9PROT|nr:transcriptional regulator [Oceanibacterium hippocampi]SLN56199.1 transcriptional repressor DicA [Oceanibacterium hippocampi]
MAEANAKQPQSRANHIDAHVGRQLRLRRTLLGMSQGALGDALGLTFQQVQKYERGANRIGASRLFAMSRVLKVPVAYFFEGANDNSAAKEPEVKPKRGQRRRDGDPVTKRETLELVRAYFRIEDPELRKDMIETIRAIAESLESRVK